VGEITQENNLKFHLDGARIFNAAAALQVDPAALVESADSVMFCLSKGLGAPVGSVLCGREEFITRARKTRKMLGGGMRQAGLLAAAGLYALEKNLPLLSRDHQRAAKLARGLKELEGLSLKDDPPPTNMVYVNLDSTLPLDAGQMAKKLKKLGILVGIPGERQFRLVTHIWIGDQDIKKVVQAFKEVLP
jgi:threonine aldolase